MFLQMSRGFTLLEVVIALGILAVGLVVILEANILTMQMVHRSSMSTKAMLLAERKFAEIEGQNQCSPCKKSGRFEMFPDFHWKESVSLLRIGESDFTGVLRVEVVVSWTRKESSDEQVSLVSYLPGSR